LPETIRPHSATLGEAPSKPAAARSLSQAKKLASNDAEKRYLEESLHEVKGNVAELARRTAMNRSHLQTLLKKHGLSSKDFRVKS
jgi:DNA-binding NtrC family response regulator